MPTENEKSDNMVITAFSSFIMTVMRCWYFMVNIKRDRLVAFVDFFLCDKVKLVEFSRIFHITFQRHICDYIFIAL